MDLPNLPLVVLDTETTGFIPKVNRIIEFASVRVEGGELTEGYEQLFSIPGNIPPPVRVLTRIDDAALQGQPTFAEKRDEIRQHIGNDTIIVGQNVSFDIGMLKGEGIDLTDRVWIDTSMLASLVFPELPSYSLGSVSKELNLTHKPVHRALGDVRATLQLLERCWQRLTEVPPQLRVPLDAIISRAPEGYKRLFGALPQTTKETMPKWLQKPARTWELPAPPPLKAAPGPPDPGTVQLLEEPLHPQFLQQLIDAIAAQKQGVHWICVKNLHATLRLLKLPSGVAVIQPPPSLIDHAATKAFAEQQTYTADEATLALKLAWYEPLTRDDFPIHGGEIAVWNGKIACTEQSERYRKQYATDARIRLLNHNQFLSMLVDPDHPGHDALGPDAHVIVDDASMLEDTATKAYGWYCAVADVRAAAEGNNELTRFTDVLQIWVERTRAFKDTRYLTPGDLKSPDVAGLRKQLATLLEESSLSSDSPIRAQLEELARTLDPANLPGRICWIEQRQDGNQFVRSVPDQIGLFLKEHLYKRLSTTMLIPPQSDANLRAILPAGTKISIGPLTGVVSLKLPGSFSPEKNIDAVLRNPPKGKTIILMGSRGRIEDAFVRFGIDLENRGITLISQNLSGGVGRMQAEFTAAKEHAIWMLTPWSFESVDLPVKTIDHLILETLPFDHPSHTILSRRAEHFRDPFMEYTLPRLMHRLYRILRTFSRYRTTDGDVRFLDERLEKKEYGRTVWKYLSQFIEKEKQGDDADQLPLF